MQNRNFSRQFAADLQVQMAHGAGRHNTVRFYRHSFVNDCLDIAGRDVRPGNRKTRSDAVVLFEFRNHLYGWSDGHQHPHICFCPDAVRFTDI